MNEQVWTAAVDADKVDLSQVVVLWRSPGYADYHWLARPGLDDTFGAGTTQAVTDLLDQVETLMDKPDPPTYPRSCRPDSFDKSWPRIFDRSGARRLGAVEEGQQRALAGTAGTQDRDPLAGHHAEVDVAQAGVRPMTDGHVAQGHQGCECGHPSNPCSRATSSMWS